MANRKHYVDVWLKDGVPLNRLKSALKDRNVASHQPVFEVFGDQQCFIEVEQDQISALIEFLNQTGLCDSIDYAPRKLIAPQELQNPD